jgi:AcrR family transcriptional regulator
MPEPERPATVKRRRPRRTTEQLRADLLAAAAEVFARRGYAGATIHEISELADTPQASIYRHYGSKAALFVAAVAEPFTELLADYTAIFKDQIQVTSDPRAATRGMITALYDNLRGRHQAVFALIAASREPEAEPAITEAVARLDEMFEMFHQFGVELWRQGVPYRVDRAEMWQRLATGMVVSATVLDTLFMPRGNCAPGREELIDIITDLVTGGFLDAPRSSVTEPSERVD